MICSVHALCNRSPHSYNTRCSQTFAWRLTFKAKCLFNSWSAKLPYLNFYPLEAVSRYRDMYNFKWVQITQTCLRWDETFANIVV